VEPHTATELAPRMPRAVWLGLLLAASASAWAAASEEAGSQVGLWQRCMALRCKGRRIGSSRTRLDPL